jgi:hypothetical protein
VGSGEPDITLIGSNGNSVQIKQNPAAVQGVSLLLPATSGTLATLDDVAAGGGGGGAVPTLDEVLTASADMTTHMITVDDPFSTSIATHGGSFFSVSDDPTNAEASLQISGGRPKLVLQTSDMVSGVILPSPTGFTNAVLPQGNGTLMFAAEMDQAIENVLAAVPTKADLTAAKKQLRKYVRDQIATLKADIIRELREVDL